MESLVLLSGAINFCARKNRYWVLFDEAGMPIPGVSVLLKEQPLEQTDFDGKSPLKHPNQVLLLAI
jgi:hypothetical protein